MSEKGRLPEIATAGGGLMYSQLTELALDKGNLY
jgi:hypothetical protein